MKIGFDANPLLSLAPGGIEVYLANLVRHLAVRHPEDEYLLYFNFFRSRHKCTVARHQTFGNVTTRICRIHPRIMTRLHSGLGLPVDWVIGRVDLVHYPSFVALPQRRGAVVITVHDLIPLRHPEFCPPHVVAEFQRLVPSSIRRADAIIAVSVRVKAEVVAEYGIPGARIHVVPNGVDEAFHRIPRHEARARVQQRYGISAPYILFVGTHETRKNLPRLVEAFANLPPRLGQELTLVVAGKPAWDSPRIADTIERLKLRQRVRLPGHVPLEDLPFLYSGAEVFLFPSLAEGFGIPPLEAMACGTPVVVGDVPVMEEVVGNAALRVHPTRTEEITAAIIRVLEDDELRDRLIARGLERAARFTWARTAAGTHEVYEAIVGRRELSQTVGSGHAVVRSQG